MRLRNIPRAKSTIEAHQDVIKDAENWKGHWEKIFGNTAPIHIEIGMGKGRFLLQMAARNSDVNYIGIERYSSVLLRAIERYDTQEFRDLTNVRFLCMDAHDLENIFAPGEVDRIYLNFSDPWPKARHAQRRLTSLTFFGRYGNIIQPNGRVEFKTDNQALFQFSLEQVEEASGWTLQGYTCDLHHDEAMNEGNVMTEYEEKFSARGNPIYKLIAVRNG